MEVLKLFHTHCGLYVVDFAQCNCVQYLKQSSKVSTVVRSQAPKKLCFSTKGWKRKKRF